MVTELRELLSDAAAGPPPEPVDAARLLDVARSRVRSRRRLLIAGASAASVLAVVAGSLAVQSLGDGEGTGDAHITRSNRIVGPVTHLESARTAIAGKDYEQLATYTNRNLDRANGRLFAAVTPDGQVLYFDGPTGVDSGTQIGMLDPVTGQTTQPFPDSIGKAGVSRAIASDRWIVWIADTETPIWVFDRETGETRALTDDELSADPKADKKTMRLVEEVAFGPDDRLYYTYSDFAGMDSLTRPTLMSIALKETSPPREEARVGNWSITGNSLVFTRTYNEPVADVFVRDLTTGDETRLATHSGGRCNQLRLDATPDRIIMFQYCGESKGVRDDRIQILDMSGDPVTTIQADGMDGHSTTSSFVTLATYQDPEGTYVYSLEDGRLLRLSTASPMFARADPGYDDLLTWGTPVNRDKGMKLWVGRFN